MIGCLQYIVWDVAPDLYVVGIPIHLYGVFFAFGLLVGGMAVIHLMRRYTASQSYLIYAFVGILIGARLFHCLFYDPMYYASHVAEIFLPIEEEGGKVVFGGFRGLASHGGVVGLMVALAIFARRNGLNYLEVCDIFAVATPLTGGFVRRDTGHTDRLADGFRIQICRRYTALSGGTVRGVVVLCTLRTAVVCIPSLRQ